MFNEEKSSAVSFDDVLTTRYLINAGCVWRIELISVYS